MSPHLPSRLTRALWRMWGHRLPPAALAEPADLREARLRRKAAEQELAYTVERRRLVDRLVGAGPDAPSDDEFARLVSATFQRRPRGAAR